MKLSTINYLFSASVISVSALLSISASATDFTHSVQSINYQCDGDKSIQVTYGFNIDGEPTYASAKIKDRLRFLPLDFSRTDAIDTHFGFSDGYVLASSALSAKTANQPMLITSPSNEILFKNCEAK